jgi:hypothetical protein
LSKALDDSLVCPYLFKVEPTAVEWPLAQFHLERADKEGTRKLLATINNTATEKKLEPAHLQESFDVWWPQLEKTLAAIKPVQVSGPRRSDRDLLEEILITVRQLHIREPSDEEAKSLQAKLTEFARDREMLLRLLIEAWNQPSVKEADSAKERSDAQVTRGPKKEGS